MVTHAPDSSFSPPEPEKDLADQILDKVSKNMLDDAYDLLRSGMSLQFKGMDENHDGIKDAASANGYVPMNQEERQQAVDDLMAKLAKKPDAIDKLSAGWLSSLYEENFPDKNKPGKLAQQRVADEAKNGDAIDKVLGTAALKDLHNVANIATQDDLIDSQDVFWNTYRKVQKPSEEYAKDFAARLEKNLKENPAEALKKASQEFAGRALSETNEETGKTYNALVAELKNHPELMAQASAMWMHNNFTAIDRNNHSGFSDGRVSAKELEEFGTKCTMVEDLFLGYMMSHYKDISGLSTQIEDDTQITQDEIAGHVARVKAGKK